MRTKNHINNKAIGAIVAGGSALVLLSSSVVDGQPLRNNINNGNVNDMNVNAGNDNNDHQRNLAAITDFSDPRSVTPREPGQPVFSDQMASLNNNGNGVAALEDDSHLPPPPVIPNAHPTFESLLEQYVLDTERSQYLINVGAQDGKTHDPTYDLLYSSGYYGLLFEGFERQKKPLFMNIAELPYPERVRVSWGYVSPETILGSLQEGGARYDADVLKVDIDSFDAHIMETILSAGYTPKVVSVEFNPDVPPPMAWHQLYANHPHNVKKERLGNYGATASAWYEIMTEKFGYGLVGMELTNEDDKCLRCEHNMWFVSKEFLNRRGYRATNHEEMVKIFWNTHYALGASKVKCIHAQNPCLLFPPREILEALPDGRGKEMRKMNPLERNVAISLMLAEEDISCDLWKVYESSVVGQFLRQMEDGCNCKGCVEGDPCLQAWKVHTKPSNIC